MKDKNTFSKLKSYCTRDAIPHISDATRLFLQKLLQTHKPQIALEIGSAAGYSTCIIAQTLQARSGVLYSFEVSFPQYKKCIHNLSKYKVRNATCYHYDGTKPLMKKLVYEKVDFCFIDGQKAQYKDYLQLLLPRMSTDAMIVLDDCIKYKSRMKSLYEYLEKKQINYELHQLDHDDGVIVINV